jgi:hypothetical protein
MALWQHQLEGVERIMRDDYVHALLWQPGAGKSRTVIEALDCLYVELGRPIRVLIVCPKSVLGVWPQEFEKHCLVPFEVQTLDGPIADRLEILAASGPRGGVLERAPVSVCLLGYSTFSAKPHAKAAAKAVSDYAPDVIVLDESHNIKGAQSNTSKLLGQIGQLCPRRLILTGTPTPHSPGDVYGQWRFLDPSAFAGPDGKMVSWSRWLQGYCNTPDAPILMFDGTFKNLGDIVPGDIVMGWGRGSGGYDRRVWVPSVVQEVRRRRADNVVQAVMESGHTIKCTRDHNWLSSTHGGRDRAYEVWTTVLGRGQTLPEDRKRKKIKSGRTRYGSLSRAVDLPPVLTEEQRIAAAWLGGIYDGEGSWNSISQSESHNPEVCAEIERVLDLLGFQWTKIQRNDRAGMVNYCIGGGWGGAVRWINTVPHVRTKYWQSLIHTGKVSGTSVQARRVRDRVVAVTPLPDQDVVSMQTSTGNYVAWGMLSKNCIFGGFQGRQIVGWRDIDDMEERMARKSSVVYTRDCHTMDELRVQKIPFKLSASEAAAYLAMRRDLLVVVNDETITASNKLVSVLRLRQVCAGFLPNEDGVVRQIGTTRQDLAVDLLHNIGASEARQVVFAWSRHEIDSLVLRLRANPPWDAEIHRIAGDTKDREAILKRFSSGDPQRMILVAQTTTLSSGTNALTGANQVLYLSLSQRTDEWIQSLARFHRPGQTRPVIARVLVAEGSVDEQILDALEGRVELQTALMDHIKHG